MWGHSLQSVNIQGEKTVVAIPHVYSQTRGRLCHPSEPQGRFGGVFQFPMKV